MLHDARQIADQEPLEADICIIGGGAAGITIAREFIGTSYKVVLLESGGRELEADTQDLYRGANIGRPYYDLDVCRLRYFGGTTNHWAGWCRPLSRNDFEKRSWIPYSGWPINHEILEPYYKRASKIVQLGGSGFDGQALMEAFPGIEAFAFDPQHIQAQSYQFSPPTRFGETYGPELAKAGNVSVFLHANVVRINADESTKVVRSVQYATLTGRKREVRARSYILATGGVENARLMLAANIGNTHDMVGRFFMEHPEPSGGVFLVIDQRDRRWAPFAYHHPERHSPTLPLGCISISRELQQREKIANTRLGFNYLPLFHSDGFSAIRRIIGKDEGTERSVKQMGSDLWNVIADINGVAGEAITRVRQGAPSIQMMEIEVFGQQAPNPDSRVTLGTQKDALGLPRPNMDWRLTDFDRRSVDRTLRIVAQEFGRLGLGRMNVAFRDWNQEFYYGNHHMGTTRMSADPKQGVVDADCRVHGMSNFYVAGSSVFPTSGNAPPTFTIIALALRLADHVKTAHAA